MKAFLLNGKTHSATVDSNLRSTDSAVWETLDTEECHDTVFHILVAPGNTNHAVRAKRRRCSSTDFGGPDQSKIAADAGNLATFSTVLIADTTAAT